MTESIQQFGEITMEIMFDVWVLDGMVIMKNVAIQVKAAIHYGMSNQIS